MLIALTALTFASDLSDAQREAAPTDKSRSIDIHVEREINASADEVWALLGGGFAEIGDWATLVDASREMADSDIPAGFTVDPDAPVLGRYTATGFGEPGEVLVNYDDEQRTLTFWATDLPGMLLHSQNTQQVVAIDEDRCLVTFDVHAEPKRKFMGKMISKKFGEGFLGVLDDLAVHAETGNVSADKAAAQAALADAG